MVTNVAGNFKYANCVVRELWTFQGVDNGKRYEDSREKTRKRVIREFIMYLIGTPALMASSMTAVRPQIELVRNSLTCQVRLID